MTPRQTIAHYQILAKIGEGGMGVVYRAIDTKLGREVAIKVLPDAFADDRDRLARLTREEVLTALNHPNIAAIYGAEDGALIMELVEDVGNHSVSAPLNIGVGDVDSPLDVSYLPVITLQNRVTHEVKRTTDPGRALITGLWRDVGRLKGPILRGLASRAPYFHNGSAASLNDVLDFYEKRFHIGFTRQEKKDLIAFLNAL